MGKVRIKTLGTEDEEKQKEKAKARKEAKEAKKTAKGAHGGERVVSMAPTEEELAKTVVAEEPKETKEPGEKKLLKARPPRQRSHQYKGSLALVDRKRSYSLPEALELLRKVSFAKFDGTVELHINALEKGLTGQLTFPHGTGKKIRVAIATDKLIEDIQKGKIDFDILVSHPVMMSKLAPVAKILGPRGLMPNPKNGTISEDPEKLVEKFEKGQVNFKTESQAPIIHLTVGKLSMKDQELIDNISVILSGIGKTKIRNITLKSTMSPGIKIDFS